MKSTEANDKRTTLWVRAELGMVYKLGHVFKIFLSTPGIREQSPTYRKRIVRICLNLYENMKSRVLAECLKRIEASSIDLQEGDPFEY